MGYPTLTLSAANAVFSGIGIEITRHQLGYYEAQGLGQKWQASRLLDLTHLILQQITGQKETERVQDNS